jgi:hypothetical protein
MSWKVQHGYMGTRIVESEDILGLKKFIQDNKIKCDVIVDHCDYNFWKTKEERSVSSNMVIGYSIFEDTQPLPVTDDKNVYIRIQIDNTDLPRPNLEITSNSLNETLNTWSSSPICKKISYKKGVYKRKGFDQTFNGVKSSYPYITEKEFASSNNNIGGWDNDLVKIKLYDGEEGCIDTIEEYKIIKTDKSSVTLKLLSIDVQKNIYLIKGWLMSHK